MADAQCPELCGGVQRRILHSCYTTGSKQPASSKKLHINAVPKDTTSSHHLKILLHTIHMAIIWHHQTTTFHLPHRCPPPHSGTGRVAHPGVRNSLERAPGITESDLVPPPGCASAEGGLETKSDVCRGSLREMQLMDAWWGRSWRGSADHQAGVTGACSEADGCCGKF